MQKKNIDEEVVHEAFNLLGIHNIGLNASDRILLETIAKKFNGGPVGLNTLAASLAEEEATIEEFNEPYLLQIGFIERTPRGRILTKLGYNHLGLEYPEDKNK